MKIAWATDLHLNFVNELQIIGFCNKVKKAKAEVLFLTGDISEAPYIVDHLRFLEKHCKMPIYFICGNHDYYKGSVKKLREVLSKEFGTHSPKNNSTFWMNEHGVITLESGVALIGHDGWYDGGYASFLSSKLGLNDFLLIEELRSDSLNTFRRNHFKTVYELAKEGAQHIEKCLEKAYENHDIVYLLTHAPPFREGSRAPDGKLSDPDWLPYFSSRCMGEAILKVMKKLPSSAELNVLCGHTHTDWLCKPRTNISCYVGGANYRYPNVCRVFDI